MIYLNERRHLDFCLVFLSLLFMHLNKIEITAVDPVYSILFQDLLKCGHEISIRAYTFDTQFICYNFSFEELFVTKYKCTP